MPLRRHPPGFASLVGIMIGQQLSTASAAAIFGRLKAQLDPLTPAQALAAGPELLRACGLSAAKMKTLAAMAEAVESGRVPLDALAGLPADDARAILCTVPGIGPWTADLYLLFALGNPDAFPAGDLALQEAARLGFALAGAAERAGAGRDRGRPGGRAAGWRPSCYGLIIAGKNVARARRPERGPHPGGRPAGGHARKSCIFSEGLHINDAKPVD